MFSGSMPALVTPMSEEGAVDYQSLAKLVDMHLNSGTAALVVLGTTGESGALTHEEKHNIVQQVVKQVDGKIPVIMGIAAAGTQLAVEQALTATTLGVDGLLVLCPYYVKPTQEGLYQHFKSIAEAVPLPIILYNVPGRTVSDLLPETVARLATISNIVGIKEATGLIERTQQIVELCSDQIDVYSGDDITALECLFAGGKGVISVTANIAPAAMSTMCQAVLAHDTDSATTINQQLMPLHHALFVESNPIPLKWALYTYNKIPIGIRLPMTVLSVPEQARLKIVLEQTESLLFEQQIIA